VVAVAFAVGSMLCAALNDMAFKLFAARKNSIGLYMSVIGIVWTMFFFLRCGEGINFPYIISGQLLTWGIIAGIFSASANILLIEGMAVNEVGTCSTIYRLNLAPAALMAFLILGEDANPVKLAGIAFAVGSTLMLFNNPDKEKNAVLSTGLWIVVIAALLRAGMGISYKYALTPSINTNAFLAINGFVWISAGFIYHLFKNRKAEIAESHSPVVFFGLISGILVCGIVLFMALALKAGDASTVLPVAQLSFIITAGAGIIFLGEPFSMRKAGGFAMAVLCIILMGAGA
jgi:uncharacterized membrane protein